MQKRSATLSQPACVCVCERGCVCMRRRQQVSVHWTLPLAMRCEGEGEANRLKVCSKLKCRDRARERLPNDMCVRVRM